MKKLLLVTGLIGLVGFTKVNSSNLYHFINDYTLEAEIVSIDEETNTLLIYDKTGKLWDYTTNTKNYKPKQKINIVIDSNGTDMTKADDEILRIK